MKRYITIMALLVGLLLAGGSIAHAGIATSPLGVSDEGWTLAGDASGDVIWQSQVGLPPGSILGQDLATGDTWSFVAPEKFLGDSSAAYGGTLSYDILISARDAEPWAWPFVKFQGEQFDLHWSGTWPTAGQWTHYQVQLTPEAGWTRSTGGTPSGEEMLAVLGNLQGLLIRGEFKTYYDEASLDNIALVPEPATICLLGLGSLGLIRKRRRR